MAKHFTRGKYRDEDQVIDPSLTAIENAYDVLLALPDADSARFFKLEDHQRGAASGELQYASQYLFFDALNWLKFFWWTSAFKARQLTSVLVSAYNADNFLSWLVLGRSSLEYAAVSYYFASKIDHVELQGPVVAVSQLKGFEDLLSQYADGTRFNWADLFAGNRDGPVKKFTPTGSSGAVNVLTALDHLARRDSRYSDVRIAYDMLSDFAHPNMASHAAVIEMPTAPGDMHECLIAAQPGALRGEFIMVARLP